MLFRQLNENVFIIKNDFLNKHNFKSSFQKLKSNKVLIKLPMNIFYKLKKKELTHASISLKIKFIMLFYFIFSKIPFIKSTVNLKKKKRKTVFLLNINIKNLLKLNVIVTLNIFYKKYFFFTKLFSIQIKYLFKHILNYEKQKSLYIKIKY